MNILFISRDFSGAALCARLHRESNNVRAFVADPLCCQILDGLVEKVATLDDGISWVGRDGLIVVDDVGFGALQDRLRGDGYAVVGGSAGGDLLENDRLLCQKVLADHGIRTVPIHYFDHRDDAIAFVKSNPGRWVLKQNGQSDKTFCYVGKLSDGSDVLDLLEYYGRKTPDDTCHFILQQHIDGVEIGVGRYFNGINWLGPVELNIEHKNLFPGGIGPKTYEMGTLMWYDPDEDNRLFREVLAPLAPYLRKINFRGDFEINCIVNQQGAFPLEATSRFGYPAVQLQTELHCSPWGEFLRAVARGEEYQLEYRQGYGIVVLIALPPFPFYQCVEQERPLPQGLKIHFREAPDAEELRHYHPEEVTVECGSAASTSLSTSLLTNRSLSGTEGKQPEVWRTCSDTGYVMHVSSLGGTVAEAREQVYRRIGNVVIPKMFYRSDIGMRFLERDRGLLERWGYFSARGEVK